MTGLDVVRGMGFRSLRLALFTGFAALLVLACLASSARAGDRVYWANDKGANRISFANLDGSGGGNLSTAGAASGQPRGVTMDVVAGKVYWTNPDNNRISFANLDGSGGGGNLNTAGATVDRPNAAAVYPAAGKIYWANEFGDRISFANLNDTGGGNLTTTGATVDVPIGPTVDPGSGRIYWGNANPRNVISYANMNGTGGGDINTTGATVNNPHGVAIDPVTNRIYWANVGANRISYANLNSTGGGNLSTTGATVSLPVGVAIDPSARKIYWGNEAGNKISWANLDTSGAGDLSTPGATLNGSRSPALLQVPRPNGAPAISGGSTTGSVLTCSQGSWLGDLLGSVLYRAPQSFAYSWTLNGATIPGATATTHTASAPGDYRCTVTASNPAGSSFQTSAAHAVSQLVTPPAAPTLSATAGDRSVHLSWTPPSNGGAPITNYKIYRGTASGNESLLTTVGNVTTYDDGTVSNGTRYYYRVSAVNSAGEGAQSNEVSAVPIPSITINDVSHPEGNSGQTDFSFTASLTNSSTQTVTVAYATQDGTATTADSDYTAASGTITFNPGQTSKNVVIKVNGDTTFESTEGFTVNLSGPSGATIADAAGLGTITNDDAQPQISINDISHPEGNSGQTDFTFAASLTNASTQTVTVAYATQDGTATTADSDYTAASGTITFNPGQTSKNVVIKVNGDTTFESTEGFTVNLSGPSGATIADAAGLGTITNDDTQPQISVADMSHTEGASGTTDFTVQMSLSNPSSQQVTVDISTQDGTATVADQDYEVLAPLQVTFSPGATQRSANVTVRGDSIYEPDETFGTLLENPVNAAIADPTGVGTIQNDDAQPSISVSDVAAPEGDSGETDMNFTVSLANPSSQTVSVDYATQNGTADAGSDYIATSGSLSFDPGQVSRQVTVKALGDTVAEIADETFTLRLSGPVHATIADDAGLGTIQNDDFNYPRPKSATPVAASLVLAYEPCADANGVHDATPGGSCTPPAQSSPNLTAGTPDANRAAAQFAGLVRLRVCSAPACTDADVAIEASLTDVRCQGGALSAPVCSVPNSVAGPDYAGELGLKLPLRITDRANAPAGGGAADQGTVQDLDFSAAINCAPTVDSSVGGQCDLVTTANGLVPGAVTSGSRSIWELGQVEVDDAGPDGSLSTPEDAAPFAVQGIFAP